MLDSDWLIAVIFFFFYKFRPCIVNLQNFYFLKVYLDKILLFFMVFAKSYLPFLPFTETLVTKFAKRYQVCVLCNLIR